MTYECERCTALLPPGARACPHCGDPFDEPVPADAVIPVTEPPSPIASTPTPTRADNRLRILMPLALLLACGGFAASLAWNSNHALPKGGTPHPVVSPQHVVIYTVTGTASSVDVAYRDGSGSRQQLYAVPLPWSQTERMTTGSFMYLSAQNRTEEGEVVTEIAVDGAQREKSDENAAFAISVVDDSL